MRFPANCLIVTAVAAMFGGRPRAVRNRAGRWHLYWLDADGLAFEFYTKGASRRSYLRNALTLGEVKRCPSFDEIEGVEQ
jgi:hypothetical protein